MTKHWGREKVAEKKQRIISKATIIWLKHEIKTVKHAAIWAIQKRINVCGHNLVRCAASTWKNTQKWTKSNYRRLNLTNTEQQTSVERWAKCERVLKIYSRVVDGVSLFTSSESLSISLEKSIFSLFLFRFFFSRFCALPDLLMPTLFFCRWKIVWLVVGPQWFSVYCCFWSRLFSSDIRSKTNRVDRISNQKKRRKKIKTKMCRNPISLVVQRQRYR